jgi:magnesium transporter
MPVGKAEVNPSERAAAKGSGFTVPCLAKIDEERIRQQLERDHFFWLDLEQPSAEDLERLRTIFGFHPLAIEDAGNVHQRPKLDDYGDYIFMVFYGADEQARGDDDLLHEVDFFVSGQYLITVHREHVPTLDNQRDRLDGQVLHSEQFLLYRVMDTLTDTFFPVLARIDDEIDSLEDAVIANPSDEQLQRMFGLKRQLVALRKVVTPQRDIFARSIDQISDLPGLLLDERDYFRDVYDHLIRISDMLDSYRDLLSGATDLYLSTVSNRQNEVMKQLAIVGTIFLPLSFLTGFFGQNFGWLVNKGIQPTWTFWVFGIGSMVATCIGLFAFFRRKGWM